jgi:hypothetical protein
MNITKTKEKLKNLSDQDLNILLELVQLEKENRFGYQSNLTHTPREMYKSLAEALGNAWIHG